MRVAAHDQGFVAAPVDGVYRELADLARYERWWPDAAVGEADLRLGRWRFAVETSNLRKDTGLVLHLRGPCTGTLEWYLEPEGDGTIVNSILNLDPPRGRRRSERALLRVRRAIHRGLVGLKGRLE